MTSENEVVLKEELEKTVAVVKTLEVENKTLGELSCKLSVINTSLLATCHSLYGLHLLKGGFRWI